jgi:putative phosphoesterase
MKIGLLSDSHSFIDPQILKHLNDCDEVWHVGDFGSFAVVEALEKLGKPLRGVYGNIDGAKIRSVFPEVNNFEIEGFKVSMVHIGGYPGKYTPLAKKAIEASRPHLFLSGHSHILKIMPDNKYNLLHINPGAVGNEGWHKVRTLILFDLQPSNHPPISNLRVVELGPRGSFNKNTETYTEENGSE